MHVRKDRRRQGSGKEDSEGEREINGEREELKQVRKVGRGGRKIGEKKIKMR